MRYEDEVKGKAKQIKGTAKANVGRLVKDRDLESSGEVDRATGRAQEKLGRGKRKVGEAIRDLGEKVAS